MSFNVFIEQASDPSPAGQARLVAAMHARFGIPEAQLAQYLAAGRFRVKGNVDEDTARRYLAELTSMGAIVTVEDIATGARAFAPSAAVPPPQPPVERPPPARPSTASAPATDKSGKRFESGLAAAFSSEGSGDVNLSALDNLSAMSLSSLDGQSEEALRGPDKVAAGGPLSANAFSAPDELGEQELQLAETPKATLRPSGPPPGLPKPGATSPGALRPGLRPSGQHQGSDQFLDLQTPIPGPMPGRPSSAQAAARPPVRASGTPAPAAVRPPPAPPVQEEPGELLSFPSDLLSTPEPAPARAGRTPAADVEGGPLARFFVDKPRRRIMAGAALALVLGYVPAELYATGAEDSRYASIRSGLAQVQKIETESQWEALESERTVARADLERARSRVRMNFTVLWLVASSGLAALWFKKLA